MRGKLTLTKNFGAKANIEEIKAMAQEIWNMSILYPKTPKKFCHNIKLGKIIMNSEVFCKKALLKNFSRKHLCWILFLTKMKAYRPANLLKRHYKADVFFDSYCKIFKNRYFEEHLWTAASESSTFYVSLKLYLHEQIT